MPRRIGWDSALNGSLTTRLTVPNRLVGAALDFARDNGVRLVEAYPVDKPERSHDDFMFFGSRSLYERAGFTEVVRRSPTRVVMRRRLRPRG